MQQSQRTHNARFMELMDLHMPDWRAHRDELADAPLAAEEWGTEDTA